MSGGVIRVLVIDDSAVVREAVKRILNGRPGWSVRAAPDAVVALERIRKESPDVILLDLEMPRMNGLTFLRHIMAIEPIPVVVCSGYADHGTERAAAALELGAVEIFPKPKLAVKDFLDQSGGTLAEVLERAAAARVMNLSPTAGWVRPSRRGADRGGATAAVSSSPGPLQEGVEARTVLLGASLGGPRAIGTVLGSFPPDGPPCILVQHMLSDFTEAFVERLDDRIPMRVRIAEEGDRPTQGVALVAPGGRHLRIESQGQRAVIRIEDGPPVGGHRPSISVLFESGAATLREGAVAALLTGMGNDGARGLRALRDAGARTLVQDESTSTVFGMPAAALALGAAEETLPLDRIGPRLLALAAAVPIRARSGAGDSRDEP